MASGAVTVGGLVINLSADTGQLRTDMAQNVRTMDTSARAISKSMTGITDSTGRVTDAGTRLVRQLRDEIATFGSTSESVQQYRTSINGLGGDLRSHEDAVRTATSAQEAQRSATSMLADALKALAAGYAALKVGEYVKDATLLAARYETLGVVMTNVGKNAGYNAAAMDQFAAGLQSQGISMVQSRESLTTLAQAHVDLSKSMKLARVAQDAAVIGGISSSEAFQRMTVGIQQGDVEILRNLGLNVNFQAAYALTAATLHKHVDLLTNTEMTQARVNAVLAVGSDIAGTYEQAMNTAGKQLSSMSRYMEDLKVKVGSVFLEAFTKQVQTQTLAFKGLGLAMDDSLKGGALTAFAAATGAAAANVASSIVLITTTLVEHKEAVQDVIAVYAIYKAAMLAAPLVEAAAAVAAYIKVLVTQGTVTWGATGAALAKARAEEIEALAAQRCALSANASAVANVEQAEAMVAATTSVQGQFIATEALTAAQAAQATTSEALIITSGEVAVANGAVAAAEGAAAIGTWALTTAIGALEAALALLFAPITLVVAAIAGAVIAYNHFRSAAAEKVENNLPSFDDTRDQLAKLNDEQKYGTGLLGDNAKQIEAVTAKIKELNLAKEAKTASIGSGDAYQNTSLKAEVAGITDLVKKYGVQLRMLEEIRAKSGGAPQRVDLGSDEQLKALLSKYTAPPARKADVLSTLQPAIDSAKKLAASKTYSGTDDEERAKAKAAALADIDKQGATARIGVEYAFASETNTANKTAEMNAQNHATVLNAVNARALSDAKAMYDMRLITQAEYVDKENALNQREAAAALAVANDKVAAAKATVGGDPVANAQAVSGAVAERDALVQKNAQQAAEGRRAAADAAIESYTKEFGSISSIADAQVELVRTSKQAYEQAGMTAEQQQVWAAKNLEASAEQLNQELEAKQANHTASEEYVKNTGAMITALNQMGAARMKAVAPSVAAQFINDAKSMRDQTNALYDEMRNTIIGTDEARVRSAAAASVKLAKIRLDDGNVAIDGTNDSDAQKMAAKKKLFDDYSKYVSSVNANADAQVVQSSQGYKALADAMSSAFDASKVESFGSSMKGAFTGAAQALGGLVDAFSSYAKQQNDNDAARKVANTLYKDDATKLAAAQSAITSQQGKDQLSYYANVADAAKGFFKENSTGYKVMQGISEAYHAAELVLELKTMATKLFATTTVTAAKTTAAVEENAAVATTVPVTLAAESAKSTAYGVSALAASLSAPFPANLAAFATVAAMLAAIGVAVSGAGGGSSKSVSEQRQEAQGSGSVLGDSSAKSDSLSKSIELTAANSSTQINYLSGLLTTLQGIQSDIKSFASELVQSTDISKPEVHLNTSNGLASTVGTAGLAAGGAALGGMAGAGLTAFTAAGAVGGPIGMVVGAVAGAILSKIPAVGKLMTSIFGGKQSVEDSGFTVGKTTVGGALDAGINGMSYADIKTSGGWFSSDKESTKETALGADANQQFTQIISSIADSITQAGALVGVSGDDFTKQLNSFVIDIGKVSLKGMTGDEIEKTLESVFSKLGDQMAQAAIPDLTQFQQVGEGYLETLVRVSSDYAKVDASLTSIGKTFGSVGVASIGAREDLISLMGGIDDFQSKTADFDSNFLTKAQQLAPVAAYVTTTLQGMNLGWVQTREQLAGVVGGLDLTSQSGRDTYAALMNLESAFAATHAAIVDTTMSEQDIADQRKDLQDKVDGLLMTSEQLRAKELLTIDASNVALYNQAAAAQSAKDALDLQAQIYEATGDKAGAAAVLLAQHQAALAQTDPALRALTQQLWDVQSAATAAGTAKSDASALLSNVDAAYSTLDTVIQREKDALQKRIDTENDVVTKLTSLGSSIKSALSSFDVTDDPAADRKAAQATLGSSLALMQSGAMLSDDQTTALQDALTTATKDSKGQFGSYEDYMFDMLKTQRQIAQLGDVTKDQETTEQKQLDQMKAQSTALDDQLAAAKQQVDLLKGIDTSTTTLAQAMSALQLSLAGAKANPLVSATPAITQAYQDSLGRAPDATGLAYWQNQVAGGTSTSDVVSSIKTSKEAQAQIEKLYQTLLGRPADAGGLDFFLHSGASLAEMDAAIKSSSEYKAKIPGFALGGDHGGGWRIVGENGPELEATGPARIFNAQQTSGMLNRMTGSSGDSTALFTAALAKMQQTMDRVSAETRSVAMHSAKTANLLKRAIPNDSMKVSGAVTLAPATA
jgi:hypothetical protein